jgi:hypothetical protein
MLSSRPTRRWLRRNGPVGRQVEMVSETAGIIHRQSQALSGRRPDLKEPDFDDQNQPLDRELQKM